MSGDAPSLRGKRGTLVRATAEALRQRVFAAEPGALIGSLGDLARGEGVGIVTIQQAARILEHEGLLEVRRGPGGGYYGRRPDAETLERVLAAYMRMHAASFDEALDITSLLFNELCAAAATSGDEGQRAELARLADRFATGSDPADLGALESELQDLLFRMVERPIFELLTRVTLRFASLSGGPQLYRDAEGIERWKAGRRRIVAAILAGDAALARFEADRSTRQAVVSAIHRVV
jgi:GntR family transcriptional repressor for pyruvate dehydrogenase complex